MYFTCLLFLFKKFPIIICLRGKTKKQKLMFLCPFKMHSFVEAVNKCTSDLLSYTAQKLKWFPWSTSRNWRLQRPKQIFQTPFPSLVSLRCAPWLPALVLALTETFSSFLMSGKNWCQHSSVPPGKALTGSLSSEWAAAQMLLGLTQDTEGTTFC